MWTGSRADADGHEGQWRGKVSARSPAGSSARSLPWPFPNPARGLPGHSSNKNLGNASLGAGEESKSTAGVTLSSSAGATAPCPAVTATARATRAGWQLLSHCSPGNAGVSGKLLEQWGDPGCCMPQQAVIHNDLSDVPASHGRPILYFPHSLLGEAEAQRDPTKDNNPHCPFPLQQSHPCVAAQLFLTVTFPFLCPLCSQCNQKPSLSKSQVPSAVPRHCRPPELCPGALSMLLPVQRGCQAQECPTAPSPACLAARVHTRVQKKPPLIPLASALPCIHQTRKFPSSSHSKTWGAHIPTGHGSFPAQPQGENTVPKVGMAGWRRGKPRAQRWEGACIQAG